MTCACSPAACRCCRWPPAPPAAQSARTGRPPGRHRRAVMGEPESCIQIDRIATRRVHDDYTIDFEMAAASRSTATRCPNRCSGPRLRGALRLPDQHRASCAASTSITVLHDPAAGPTRRRAAGSASSCRRCELERASRRTGSLPLSALITCAATRSPMTLSVVRHMSRKRSTPRIRPMPSGGTPTMPRISAITGSEPPGTPGGADAGEDADQHHEQLLGQASGRRRRTGRGTAPSRPRTSRCRSGWRWRRWSARSARSCGGSLSSVSATRSAVGSVALDDGGRERHHARLARLAEEGERALAARRTRAAPGRRRTSGWPSASSTTPTIGGELDQQVPAELRRRG